MRKLLILMELVENKGNKVKSTYLAKKHNVSFRTIQRDIGELKKWGYDIKSIIGKDGGYWIEHIKPRVELDLLTVKGCLSNIIGEEKKWSIN